MGIVLSAFLEATVQVPPFIARGNGGSGLIVLEPRQPMPVAQLGYIAAYTNNALRWRFSWYRQATASRVKRLTVPLPGTAPAEAFNISALLPTRTEGAAVQVPLKYAPFILGSLYELRPGDYHSLVDLQLGDTPIISCGALNNGVAGFVSVSARTCVFGPTHNRVQRKHFDNEAPSVQLRSQGRCSGLLPETNRCG